MVSISPETINEVKSLLDQATAKDTQLSIAYENWHRGYPDATVSRFLKARDNHVHKAFKMLMDCLRWRIENDIDNILSKPTGPKEMFDAIRESQPMGMTGFCKKGRPVFAIGVRHNSCDKIPIDKYVQSYIQINEYRDHVLLPASSNRKGRFVGTCLKIFDMSNLQFSTLNRIKFFTIISTIDDRNYPEKTDVYYVVNAPYIFSACWKVVRPLLHERTRRKVQILEGSGRDELLKVMDMSVLPHFCKYDTRNGKTHSSESVDCFSPSHQFHQDVWNYIKKQSYEKKYVRCIPQKSRKIELLGMEEYAGNVQELGFSDSDMELDENEDSSYGASSSDSRSSLRK